MNKWRYLATIGSNLLSYCLGYSDE